VIPTQSQIEQMMKVNNNFTHRPTGHELELYRSAFLHGVDAALIGVNLLPPKTDPADEIKIHEGDCSCDTCVNRRQRIKSGELRDEV